MVGRGLCFQHDVLKTGKKCEFMNSYGKFQLEISQQAQQGFMSVKLCVKTRCHHSAA